MHIVTSVYSLNLQKLPGHFSYGLETRLYIHTKNIYIIIIVKVACSLIAPASAAAP